MKRKALSLLIFFFAFSVLFGCKKEEEENEEVDTGTLVVMATLEKDGNNLGPAKDIMVHITGEPPYYDFYSKNTDTEGKVVFEDLQPIMYSINASFYDSNTQTDYSSEAVNVEIKKGETAKIDIVLTNIN